MHFLYNCSIVFYGFLIRFAALFNAKAKLWVIGRRNWKEKLPNIDSSAKVYWFHCASLGEFDQGLPVIRELKKKIPTAYILVTFFSPSGMLHYHKRKHEVDHVMYLPLDTIANARYFLGFFNPEKIYVIKYEFWANFIFQANKRGIDIYSVSSNFRENQLYFKWYGAFFRKILKNINYFFVQTEESHTLLNSIGITSVSVVGDTRFDQVIEVRNNMLEQINNGNLDPDFLKIQSFLNGQKAIVIGSSWKIEEELVIPFILKNPNRKFIIAPHDISEEHINFIINKLENKCIRFTNYDGVISSDNCMILDTIGHLSKAYYFGDIAIIGGGFTGKLHNILEPTSFGLPVLFGPKHDKFPEAQLFIKNGLAFEFENCEVLERQILDLTVKLNEIRPRIEVFVNSFIGSSDQIIKLSN
ncbi:MAG: 3-deoxy-D-manno-octulosonic acid transferase [Bacteroidota bacterium]